MGADGTRSSEVEDSMPKAETVRGSSDEHEDEPNSEKHDEKNPLEDGNAPDETKSTEGTVEEAKSTEDTTKEAKSSDDTPEDTPEESEPIEDTSSNEEDVIAPELLKQNFNEGHFRQSLYRGANQLEFVENEGKTSSKENEDTTSSKEDVAEKAEKEDDQEVAETKATEVESDKQEEQEKAISTDYFVDVLTRSKNSTTSKK